MNATRRDVLKGTLAAGALATPLAAAGRSSAAEGPIRIGLLSDFGGPYADQTGKPRLLAVNQAVADMGGSLLGRPIEVLSADFQNKIDVGLTIARDWIDNKGVNVIVDAPNSAIALALASLVREKNKVFLVGATSSDLTGKGCTENSVRFVTNTYPISTALGQELVKAGTRSWFTLTVDYALGHSMEREFGAAVTAAGGQVLGAVRHPFNTADFSSFLLQAQASGAKGIAFASAGGDLINALKQAYEFGLMKDHVIAAPDMQLTDVVSAGLAVTKGLQFAQSWYWDTDDATRAFSRQYLDKLGAPPIGDTAGCYSAMSAWLRAVQAVGADTDGRAVVRQLRTMTVNDIFVRDGHIRQDGQLIADMSLYRVKAPDQSKARWDVLERVGTLPADRLFGDLRESACPLARQPG